jgi:hypothetical protein
MTIKGRLGVVAAMALFVWLIILPAVRNARERARRADCTNNLKLIGLAMHNYHDRYGCFPAAATFNEQGRPLLSWRVTILPFMEQDALYREFRLNEPWYSPPQQGPTRQDADGIRLPAERSTEGGPPR